MNQYVKMLEIHIHPNKQLILQHPFLQAMKQGTLTKNEIQDFAIQYSFLYDYVPKFASAVITRIPDTETSIPFVEYLWEEYGRGNIKTSYNSLMDVFLESIMGSVDKEIVIPYPSTIEYTDKLLSLCLDERVPIGFGVLVIGVLFWFPEEFNLIMNGLLKYKNISKKDVEFWDSRAWIMQKYYPQMVSVMEKWIDSEENKHLLMQAADHAMEFKLAFWEGLSRFSSSNNTLFTR
jgi:thiaminase